MNKGLLVLIALVAFVFALPTSSDAKIEITGAALVSAQDVDFDTTSGNLDEDFNFNDPRVNLYVNGEVSDKISVTAKFWATNDWSAENERAAVLADAVEMRRAFLTLKDVAGSGFDLKVGTIDIPYGWEYGMRTANGDDMKNDFITNSLLDINGGSEGLALSGSFDMGQTSTPLAWEIALLNGSAVADGNPSGTGEQARSNDDLAWAIRAEVGLQENLTLQASFYTNDQRKDGAQDPLNIGSVFLNSAVNHGPAGALVATNANLNGLVRTGSTGTSSSYDRDLWEVSAKYDFGQGYLMGFWGNVDADSTGVNTNREWDYLGLQGRYNFDENSYLAVRWNQLDPDYQTGIGGYNLGEPTLWSIGAGYKLADNAMVKAEWSSFDEDGADFGDSTNTGAVVAGNGNQDADALTISVGVSF